MSTLGTLDAINNLDPETFQRSCETAWSDDVADCHNSMEEYNNLTNNGEKPTLVASAGNQRLP